MTDWGKGDRCETDRGRVGKDEGRVWTSRDRGGREIAPAPEPTTSNRDQPGPSLVSRLEAPALKPALAAHALDPDGISHSRSNTELRRVRGGQLDRLRIAPRGTSAAEIPPALLRTCRTAAHHHRDHCRLPSPAKSQDIEKRPHAPPTPSGPPPNRFLRHLLLQESVTCPVNYRTNNQLLQIQTSSCCQTCFFQGKNADRIQKAWIA